MSIFQKVRSLFGEKRSNSEISDFFFNSILPHVNTFSGKTVTAETALTFGAVYACVKVISESLASLPIVTFELKKDGSKEEVPNHQVAQLLRRSPNSWQTPMEWKEMMQAHMLLRGNAYSQIVYSSGRPIELIPIHPARVTPKMNKEGRVEYEYRPPESGEVIVFDQDEIFHLKNMTLDGLIGISTISAARETIGLGLAQQEHGSRLFGQGAKPAGVLQHPGRLQKDGADRLRKSWRNAYGGIENSHSVAVLEEGMTFQQIELTSEDSQWLESRKFSVEEVARVFRVQLHKLMSLDRATFSNIEQQSIEFAQDTIFPHAVRWQESIVRDLLSNPRDKRIFVEYRLQDLLRGDLESRYKSYAIGRQNGWLSANDVRALEGMNPIGSEGDVYWAPVNMTNAEVLEDVDRLLESDSPTPELNEPSEDAGEPAQEGESTGDIQGSTEQSPRALPDLSSHLEPVFYDAFRRCKYKEATAVNKAMKRDAPLKYIEKFYETHENYLKRELRPCVETYIRVNTLADSANSIDSIVTEAVSMFAEQQVQISQDVIRKQFTDSRKDSLLSDMQWITDRWEGEDVIRANIGTLMSIARNLIEGEKDG